MSRFILKNNEVFEYPNESIFLSSSFIRPMLDEMTDGCEDIPIDEVDLPTMKLLVKFLELNDLENLKDLEKIKPVRAECLKTLFEHDEIYDFFTNLSDEELFSIMKAADYLDIENLLNAASATFANRFIHIETEEGKKLFVKKAKCF